MLFKPLPHLPVPLTPSVNTFLLAHSLLEHLYYSPYFPFSPSLSSPLFHSIRFPHCSLSFSLLFFSSPPTTYSSSYSKFYFYPFYTSLSSPFFFKHFTDLCQFSFPFLVFFHWYYYISNVIRLRIHLQMKSFVINAIFFIQLPEHVLLPSYYPFYFCHFHPFLAIIHISPSLFLTIEYLSSYYLLSSHYIFYSFILAEHYISLCLFLLSSALPPFLFINFLIVPPAPINHFLPSQIGED